MSLIYAGGWVMIPLLLISVIVLALIIDRSLTLIWNPMPDKTQREKSSKRFALETTLRPQKSFAKPIGLNPTQTRSKAKRKPLFTKDT